MSLFSLALRNLFRNRRRSLTTLLAMIVGLVAILLFGGYRSNLVYGMETGHVQGSGHLQIQRLNYFLDGSDNPIAYGISDYKQIIDDVKRDSVLAPMLTVVTPTLQLGGIAGNFAAGVSRSVIATGMVIKERNQMYQWNDYGMTGYGTPIPLDGTSEDAIVVGTGVARKLKLCNELSVPDCKQASTARVENGNDVPGDISTLSLLEKGNPTETGGNRIEMLAATLHGAPNVASLTAVGARNMSVKAVDDVYVAMHLAQAQKLIYGNAPPQVTAIQIQLKHTKQLAAARERLDSLIENRFKTAQLEILDYKTLNPMYGQSIRFIDSIFGFMTVLISTIVLFTISNTMSTAVIERTVEIGTLRAMGLRRAKLRVLFLYEGMLLGFIGAVIGVLVALFIAYAINHSGLSWTAPGYSYAYLILIRIWQDMPLLLISVFGMICVTVISAWWPAHRASRMVIVDALRHV